MKRFLRRVALFVGLGFLIGFVAFWIKVFRDYKRIMKEMQRS